MKKTFTTLVCLIIFSVANFAQVTAYHLLPKPADRVLDNLNKMCSANHVKTMKHFIIENGKTELNSISTFTFDGKLQSERNVGYFKKSVYYTYSGDTTIKRTFEPDRSTYGHDLLNVTVEKFGPSGNILAAYSNSYSSESDSMKMPPLSKMYNYRDGLLVTTVFADGSTEYTAHDNHRQLLEVIHEKKVEAYRRIYQGDKISESYYSKNREPERMIEKFTYNDKGLLINYVSFSKSGAKFNYKFEYDSDNRVISEVDNCTTEKYTYNSKGYLLKDETITCSQSIVTFDYSYDNLGLLTSIVQGRAGISEVLKETFVCTFWQ